MSPYIGASEISLILPAHVSIGTNTDPLTLGEVASIITEVSAEIDSALYGAGYAVPIGTTATYAYAYMQRITKQGAGWQVLSIIFPGMGGVGDTSSLAADYRDAYNAALNAIRNGQAGLIGVTPDTTARALPRSWYTSNTGIESNAPSPLVPLLWEP